MMVEWMDVEWLSLIAADNGPSTPALHAHVYISFTREHNVLMFNAYIPNIIHLYPSNQQYTACNVFSLHSISLFHCVYIYIVGN